MVARLWSKQRRYCVPWDLRYLETLALSSALAALGTLQPRALRFLNTIDPLDTVSNCFSELLQMYFSNHAGTPPLMDVDRLLKELSVADCSAKPTLVMP